MRLPELFRSVAVDFLVRAVVLRAASGAFSMSGAWITGAGVTGSGAGADDDKHICWSPVDVGLNFCLLIL